MNKNMRKMYTEEEIGKIAKQNGGTKLYLHTIDAHEPNEIDNDIKIYIISPHKERFDTSLSKLQQALNMGENSVAKIYVNGPEFVGFLLGIIGVTAVGILFGAYASTGNNGILYVDDMDLQNINETITEL